MRTTVLLVSIFISCISFAADKNPKHVEIKLGEFWLAIEAGWTSGFELRKDGKATITPEFENENGSEDDVTIPPPAPPKRVEGRWMQAGETIEISFEKYRDQFRLQKGCGGYKNLYCFKYVKSLSSSKEKSPLNHEQPYINWDWTFKGPSGN